MIMKNLVDPTALGDPQVSSCLSKLDNPSIKQCSKYPKSSVAQTTCSICSESKTPFFQYGDSLKICVDCQVAVHGTCYGDLNSDKEVWQCRKCRVGVSKTECALCPLSEGAFTSLSDGTWVHVICSLFLPEVSFPSARMDDVLLSEDQSFLDLYDQTCSICEKKGEGVCRRCDDDECGTYFHVTCAQTFGLLVFDHQADDKIKFSAFCNTHRSANKNTANFQWISENFSSLNLEDITEANSSTRKILKKVIYRLAKSLAKTCPCPDLNDKSSVNSWYYKKCEEFFERHPVLNREGVKGYVRNWGLGFYHGSLKIQMRSKNAKT